MKHKTNHRHLDFQNEKTKQLLYQAKYGRLGLNDPQAALQRDSAVLEAKDDFNESEISQMYESQLAQLERLIAVQRKAHQRAKQVCCLKRLNFLDQCRNTNRRPSAVSLKKRPD